MIDDNPRHLQTADCRGCAEGGATTAGKSARRPPELLTRDHVARCINARSRQARLPHGGVYLVYRVDSRRSVELRGALRRKLPSCTHLRSGGLESRERCGRPGPHYIRGGFG